MTPISFVNMGDDFPVAINLEAGALESVKSVGILCDLGADAEKAYETADGKGVGQLVAVGEHGPCGCGRMA